MKTFIDKGYGKGLNIELKEYKGKKYLQIMEMWRKEDGGDWNFSKKNISITATSLKQFLEFVEDNKQGLIDEIGYKEVKKPKKDEEEN